MRLNKFLLAASLAVALASPAFAGNSTLWSSTNGDIVFPISPPTNAGATPGNLDNTVVGGTTPQAGTFTAETSTTVKLDTGTKTATASAGAATLNKSSGKITSEALTTAGLADYTLTLTDSSIAAADELFVSVTNGTNTQGTIAVGPVTPGAGSATIIIHNLHATQALNGTIIISFANLKN